MADENIKKVIVPESDLPTSGYENAKHQLRFRVVSEDRTRFSHWSPFFSVSNNGIDLSPGFVEPTNPVIPEPDTQPDLLVADFVDLVWTQSVENRNSRRRYKYDIFVRWMADIETFGDDYQTYPFELLSSQYTGTSMKVKTEKTLLNETSLYVRFVVQRASNPRRTPQLSRSPIYDSGNISLVIDVLS